MKTSSFCHCNNFPTLPMHITNIKLVKVHNRPTLRVTSVSPLPKAGQRETKSTLLYNTCKNHGSNVLCSSTLDTANREVVYSYEFLIKPPYIWTFQSRDHARFLSTITAHDLFQQRVTSSSRCCQLSQFRNPFHSFPFHKSSTNSSDITVKF